MTATLRLTSRTLSYFVLGVPAPQGSKRHVGGGVMVESSKAVAPWRQEVAAVTQAAMGEDYLPIDGPAGLIVTFFLPRPKAAKDRLYVHTKPDLDKLLRSTMDGLVIAGAVTDDSRIVAITASKYHVSVTTPQLGARITLGEAL